MSRFESLLATLLVLATGCVMEPEGSAYFGAAQSPYWDDHEADTSEGSGSNADDGDDTGGDDGVPSQPSDTSAGSDATYGNEGGDAAPGSCGDGVLDPGEDCDTTEFGGVTCEGMGHGPGQLSCDGDCRIVTDGCGQGAVCGNGTKEGGEQCDGFDYGGQTCQSLGFDAGVLLCKSNCTYDTTGCSSNACKPAGSPCSDPGQCCGSGCGGGSNCVINGTAVCCS